MFVLYGLGTLSLVDGILFYFKKYSLIYMKFVEQVRHYPSRVKISADGEMRASSQTYLGEYQQVEGLHCNGAPVWKHEDGTFKWIYYFKTFFSSGVIFLNVKIQLIVSI